MRGHGKLLMLSACLFSPLSHGGGMHEPLISSLKIDQLEWQQEGSETALAWDVKAWLGYDLNKVWLKSAGARTDGGTEASEFQFGYSRAITSFWDAQVGWRHDALPRPNRDWLVLALQGLSPYFIEVDAALFINESGQAALRLKAEYDYLFTQRLILAPELELTAYGYNDAEYGEGSGLAEVKAGVRLRYEVRREFAPYVGVNWHGTFGNSADMQIDKEHNRTSQIVVGVRAWL